MISKGYHYAINLGIVSNFYISTDTVYPGSCARGSIDPLAHYPQRLLAGHNWNHIYRAFAFYFYDPCPFYP